MNNLDLGIVLVWIKRRGECNYLPLLVAKDCACLANHGKKVEVLR